MAQNHGINKIRTVIIKNLSFFPLFPKSSLCLLVPESVTFIYSKARLRRFSNKKIFYYGYGVVTSSCYSSMHPLFSLSPFHPRLFNLKILSTSHYLVFYFLSIAFSNVILLPFFIHRSIGVPFSYIFLISNSLMVPSNYISAFSYRKSLILQWLNFSCDLFIILFIPLSTSLIHPFSNLPIIKFSLPPILPPCFLNSVFHHHSLIILF